MELEKVTAEIRPRTQWEAIDLGIRLVSENVTALFKGWMCSVYPFSLLILLICSQSIGWGIFLIWWFKPIFERVALHPLSRNLFGGDTSPRETAMVLPREIRKEFWFPLIGVGLAGLGALIHASENPALIMLLWCVVFGLLFYRSSFSRSLLQPVKYLEGLSGERYRARRLVISQRSSSTAVGFTMICLLMEIALCYSQVFFALYMIPEGVDTAEIFTWEALFSGEGELIPLWVWILLGVFYLNAVTIVAWFYTGGGFGLYVNTRTWSEGWDVELKFKGIAQRLGLIVVACLLAGSTVEVRANQEAQRILDQEDFQVQTRAEYEDRQGSSSSSSLGGASVGLFAGIGPLIFWVVVALAVGGLVWLIVANAHALKRTAAKSPQEERRKVTTVAGMNVEAERLPPNLLEEARRLWDAGRHQEALGLLYRGAISALLTRRLVEIEESDTEMDCLRRVRSVGESAGASYFQILTQAWMSQAYAKRRPDSETIVELWAKWPYQEGRKR